MYHPGFASAWLSKAPGDDVDAYKGDGDWFKILQVVGRTGQSANLSDPTIGHDPAKIMWGTFNSDSVSCVFSPCTLAPFIRGSGLIFVLLQWNFTIPATTPPGKYLVRFEHIFPNVVDAQFYLACAHIEIKNSGQVGTPGPLVKIPGVYQRGQKGE